MKKISKMRKVACNLLVLSLASGLAQAQTQHKDTTLNRTVVVEQDYNPEIRDARKINVLPGMQEITVSPNVVEYDLTASPATPAAGAPIAAFAGKEIRPNPYGGYARLGYGNTGNLDARFNYLFRISPEDRLNLFFGMDGMDGKIKRPDSNDKWDSYYYRTQAGAAYQHRFSGIDMDIAGNFGLSNFNYLPAAAAFGRQKFTSGDARFGLKSTGDSFPLRFKAETGVLLYEREFYLPDEKLSETIVRTRGDVTGSISDDQIVGIAFRMDNLFYNTDGFESRTTLLLNPYYEWKNGAARIRLGVNIDPAFGYGKKFNASPDVRAEYTFSDSYVLYANAVGGRLLNDLRRMEMENPYGNISSQPEDSYEQVNATGGFKASPVTGLWLNLYGGYQNIKEDMYHSADIAAPMMYAYKTGNTNNTYAGMQIQYDYKKTFYVSAEGKYAKWNADDEEALLLKPEFTGKVDLGVSPVPRMNISLGYTYVKRTKAEGYTKAVDAVNNLHAGFSYNVFDGVAIYARASNLLDKKYSHYLAYPAQGANFLGGLSFKF